MNTNTLKLIKYQLRDVMRSRWVIFYLLFFVLVTDALFRFGGTGDRVLLSLMNIVLLVIPLVSIMLGTMYLYNSREYTELMLCQPVKRQQMFTALFSGLVLPLSATVAAGISLPFIWNGVFISHFSALVYLLATAVGLTIIFSALAFAIALLTEDKIKGLGLAIVLWLFFAVIYDGLILLVIYMFSHYPLQQPVLVISMLNPLDLARIALLIQFEASTLMGFTGAVFQRFFGSGTGQLTILLVMLTWIGIPLGWAARRFVQKDF
ncbi:MAG: ABC transporter permease [Balneolales bacterium]|nr:ABC transporter permease [Balneolales bacterium]